MIRKTFHLFCVTFIGVWASTPAFAENKPSTSFDAKPKTTDSLKASKPSVSVQDASATQSSSAPLEAQTSTKFQMRWGVGGTVTIADTTFDVNPGTSFYFYKGGFQASLFFRVHPQITLELSIGGLGGIAGSTPGVYSSGSSYGEFASNIGARFYVRRMDQAAFANQFFIAPYVVAAFLTNLANQSPDGVSSTAAYVGGHIGPGAEFRINSNMVAFADLRVIPRVGLSSSNTFAQVGISLSGGFSYFF